MNILINGLSFMNKNEFCTNFSPVWTIIGYVIFAIKVVVPLLLIISGMITLASAVMKQKDDDIKKAQNLLVKKIVVAALVYLVITFTSIITSVVADQEWKTCAQCAFKPFSGKPCGLKNEPETKYE